MSNISYSLCLNSQNTTNRTGSSIDNYTYTIDWSKVLPTKYKTYNVTYKLKSVAVYTGSISGTGAININFDNTKIINQGGTSCSVVGIVEPNTYLVVSGSNYSWYYESVNNLPFTIFYPSTSSLNVKFTAFDLTSVFTMQNYILQLNFTPSN
jgi:hypothetical protein